MKENERVIRRKSTWKPCPCRFSPVPSLPRCQGTTCCGEAGPREMQLSNQKAAIRVRIQADPEIGDEEALGDSDVRRPGVPRGDV